MPIENETVIAQLKETITKSELDYDEIEQILKSGVVITGGIDTGKTTLAKWLITMLRPQVKLRIFDVVGNFKRNINDYQIIDKDTETVDLESDLMGFYLDFNNFNDRADIISKIIEARFDKQRAKYFETQEKPLTEYVYLVEESNVIFSTKQVNKGFILNFICLARNYGMVGIWITQRLSDSSTKIVERMSNFMFGRSMGDNDKRKIKSMIPKKYMKVFERLKEYEFLVCLKDSEPFILKLDKQTANGIDKLKIDVVFSQNKENWKNASLP